MTKSAGGSERSASALADFTFTQIAALTVIVLTPGVFAIASWFGGSLVLHFSIPVVIAELCLVVCCLASDLKLGGALGRTRGAALAAAAGLILTGALTTMLIATHRADAALHLAITALDLVFGFCLWRAFSSNWANLRRPFLIALAVGILYEVMLGYSLALSARDIPDFNWTNFRAGTTNVRQLGFYGIALSGFAAGLLATTDSRHSRIAYFFLATIGFAWTDLSGGRAAFAGATGGALLVWTLARQDEKRRFGAMLLAAFLLAMPVSLIYVPDDHIWGLKRILGRMVGFHDPDQYSSGRLDLWFGTLKGIIASPLIGHGEGQFRYEVANDLYNHPHNSILQFLYQWGLVGTGCVLIIVGPTLRKLQQSARIRPDITLPAIGALASLLLMSLLEGSLYHVFPVMVVIICLAVLASVDSKPQPT